MQVPHTDTPSLPTEVLSALNIPNATVVQRLTGGNENDNYRLSAGKYAYVVKHMRSRTAPEIELEGRYRDYLATAALPVTGFLKLSNTGYVFSDQTGDYAATEFVPGRLTTATAPIVGQLAAYMAQLHLLDPAPLPQRASWFHETYIPEALEHISPEYASAKAIFAERYEQRPRLWSGGLAQVIVHGDLHKDNYVVDDTGEVAGILDWEEACIGPAILDAAHSLRSLAFRRDRCDTRLAEAFMAGYQRARSLTQLEQSMLQPAVEYSALLLSVWAHIKRSRNEMSQELFEDLGSRYQLTYKVPESLKPRQEGL